MKIKWSRIYKRYLIKAKGDWRSAFNEMMSDYWNGAIPGVPRGRYGELPHDESLRRFVTELNAIQLAAYEVDGEIDDLRDICDAWLFFWSLIFVVSFVFEIVSLFAGNRIFVLVSLSVMVSSLAMCTFLGIKKAEEK